MLKSGYENQNCSIARTLEAVGERWTLLVIRELLFGPQRFSNLERRLPIAKNVLTNRLAKLVELGIVEKDRLDDKRDWSAYRVTDKGRDLFPVIHALLSWGDKYYAPDGPPVVLEHSCGRPAGHRVVCVSCGGVVDAASVQGVHGPGSRAVES